MYALVEEYDVGLPDLVGQNTDDGDAAVVGRVPPQLVVFPLLQRTVHVRQQTIITLYITVALSPVVPASVLSLT